MSAYYYHVYETEGVPSCCFRFRDLFPQQLQTFYLEDIRVMMAEPGDFEIIAGVGNEVFYFFGIYPSS